MKQVIGLDHVITDLSKAGATIALRAGKVVERVAGKVKEDAKQRAPQGETGDLRDSIESTRVKDGYEVGPTVRYGSFVEFGTYKDSPQPFLWPALDANTPDLIKGLEEAAGDV